MPFDATGEFSKAARDRIVFLWAGNYTLCFHFASFQRALGTYFDGNLLQAWIQDDPAFRAEIQNILLTVCNYHIFH